MVESEGGKSRFSACAANAALWREHDHALWRPHERGEPGGRRKKLFGGRGHRLLLPTRDLVSGFITDRLAHGGGDMRLGHAVTVLSQIGLNPGRIGLLLGHREQILDRLQDRQGLLIDPKAHCRRRWRPLRTIEQIRAQRFLELLEPARDG
jgi:hypothetical protein